MDDKKDTRTERVAVYLTPEVAARLSRYAGEHRWTASTAAASLIDQSTRRTGNMSSQHDMTVYAVHHDHGGWTIRTTPVRRKWTEGPDKDCEVHEAMLSPKAARSITLAYLSSLPEEEEAAP